MIARSPTDPAELLPDWQVEELAALVPLVTDAHVVEWGSGGSTLWLARYALSVWSIEHNPAWHARVRRDLGSSGRVVLRPPVVGWDEATGLDGDLRHFAEYVRDPHVDEETVAVIDGRARVACFAWAVCGGCKTIAVHDWHRREYLGCEAIAGPPTDVVRDMAIWRLP